MSHSNNVKIARNSFYLFVRTFLTIIVSLYTSRLFLELLGVEDFGIYNLVGGIVALVAVIQNLLASSMQRFLNIKIGDNDQSSELRIFNIGLTINFALILAIFILGETVGLWVVLQKLNLPIEKREVALWTYQLSLFTTLVNIYKIPYIAKIVAHERMEVFAYLSILETFVKLGITLLLYLFTQRLVVYSAFLLILSLVVLWLHIYYCNAYISKNKYVFYGLSQHAEYKELLSFSLWTLIGNCSNVARDQGIAMLFNIFFGVMMNAVIGIVNQISNVYSSLFSNVQTAFMPQIVQNSQVDEVRFARLVEICCLTSIVLISCVCIPMIINVHFVLTMWLGKTIPEVTFVFVQIIMVKILIVSFSQIFNLALMAVGNIAGSQKAYVIVSCASIILAYVLLVTGANSIMVFSIVVVMDFIMMFIRLFILLRCTNIKLFDLKKSIATFSVVLLILTPLSFMLAHRAYSFVMFASSSFTSIVIILFFVYAFVIDSYERLFINNKVKSILRIRELN